jgi:tRNA pseudouridine38-40 synthase
MRYRIDVAYHGREFHGWQKQPGLRTAQGELEIWLSRLLAGGAEISVTGAGRTDTGVHSLNTPAHFDWPERIDTKALEHRLRAALPNDLRVTSLHIVADDFHARYSAIARQYSYRIRLGAWPFDRDRQWQIHDTLALEALENCARLVLGEHDFSGFCRAGSVRQNNRCVVTESNWTFDSPILTYSIRADRFLHEMIRLMMGTFVAIARGRWGVEHVSDILRTKDVEQCGDAAPAHGLTLERVEYPDGVGVPLDFD